MHALDLFVSFILVYKTCVMSVKELCQFKCYCCELIFYICCYLCGHLSWLLHRKPASLIFFVMSAHYFVAICPFYLHWTLWAGRKKEKWKTGSEHNPCSHEELGFTTGEMITPPIQEHIVSCVKHTLTQRNSTKTIRLRFILGSYIVMGWLDRGDRH